MYLSAILEKRSVGAAMTGELTTITMPPAIIAGTETVIFFTLFLVLTRYLAALFAIMATLVCIGVIQRLIWAERHLTE